MSTSNANSEVLPLGRQTMSSGLERATNYHRWNYEWIARYLQGRILDVGGGTGNHIRFLRDLELVSVDISPECVDELRHHYAEIGNWTFEVGDITDSRLVDRLGRASFNTVLSCNVFEHIAEDERAFIHAAELLKPGGLLVLVLPAHRWLYGSMDKLAGHFRRYSHEDAARKLRVAALEQVSIRYVNLVGAMGWYVNNRIISHDDLSSGGINRQISIFDRLMIPVLKRIEGQRSMPFGQSLVCVGRKPASI
jgi:SAM-dependent methyltransferase